MSETLLRRLLRANAETLRLHNAYRDDRARYPRDYYRAYDLVRFYPNAYR